MRILYIKNFFMYNKTMKKISVLLILSLLLSVQIPAQAGVFSDYKARVEKNNVQKTTLADIKAVINEQTKQANKHCLDGIKSVYSPDFISADGFNYDVYMKSIEETWQTYPDISYTTEINKIDISDNYATVFVTETAVAIPTEKIGEFETVGELYSQSKGIYYLEKHGTVWLIHSENIIEETSMLRFGSTRKINIELNTPKQIGTNKYYTATLKVDVPKNSTAIASIGKENIIYPQTKADEAFRKLAENNTLERVFLSNDKNLNEYAVATIALSHAEKYNEKEVRVYMDGMAFIMTRVNVIPENKFVNIENKKVEKNEQSK